MRYRAASPLLTLMPKTKRQSGTARTMPMPSANKSAIIDAAVAQHLNDELTIILSSLILSIEQVPLNSPALPFLIEALQATKRCAWKMSSLLTHSQRHGGTPCAVNLSDLLDGVI